MISFGGDAYIGVVCLQRSDFIGHKVEEAFSAASNDFLSEHFSEWSHLLGLIVCARPTLSGATLECTILNGPAAGHRLFLFNNEVRPATPLESLALVNLPFWDTYQAQESNT